MAAKRMFNIKLIKSDAFTSMPLSTQALYFHLNLEADESKRSTEICRCFG